MSKELDIKIRKIIDEAIKLLNENNKDSNNYEKDHNDSNSNIGDHLIHNNEFDKDINKEIKEEIARVTSSVIPEQTGSFEKSTSPLLKYAESSTLHGSKETEPLLRLIREVFDYLPWKYNYEEREDKKNLGSYMGWAELIGPEAPYKSDDFCLGFTLISPYTLYPEHRHPAIELYKVLSGTAEWTLEGATSKRVPGEVILHPSNKIHKMQTYDQTLLALYTWSGNDVVTLSEYV
ncbi:dimethylsulfonioproprionate lyase family protein [Butyrivibrio fibrisolvens]|uniref:Cupin n=1 Tax=Butyrivibrio fibrisolvens TaxID=831 RepID=A0A317G462_BUTFI|nr:dimethylsulfonioproprionate lyase family protein [Butyrivibrio fibrisolvens]PWT25737.1 cupin [Butyrivibrio fibrisolvens]PWT27230.1 cupin [Butyrivibrio fibrisolvens]